MLDARERRRGVAVLGLIVSGVSWRTVGVASIMPFIAVASNPQLVHTIAGWARFIRLGNFSSSTIPNIVVRGAFVLLVVRRCSAPVPMAQCIASRSVVTSI